MSIQPFNIDYRTPGLEPEVQGFDVPYETYTDPSEFYIEPTENDLLDLGPTTLSRRAQRLVRKLKRQDAINQNGANVGAAIGIGSDIVGSLLPLKTEYKGKYGNYTQTLDAYYDGAADKLMASGNPYGMLAGGIMKGSAMLGKGMNVIGGGTDGQTKADAILSSSFLNMTPLGLINGFTGKKTQDFAMDENTWALSLNSYNDSLNDVQEAASKAGKKYGGLSARARRKADKAIDDARRQQDMASDILHNAEDYRTIALTMNPTNSLAYQIYTDGGYDQQAVRAAKKGAKLDPERAKRLPSKYTPVVVKDQDGVKVKTQELPELQITPDLEYNVFLNSLPDNLRLAPESEYRMYRLWELNGKPKDFDEGKKVGMFEWVKHPELPEGGAWHAVSTAYNKDLDEYEFMKPAHHKSVWMEEAFYNGFRPVLKEWFDNDAVQDHYDLIPLEGDDKKFSDQFRNDYELDKSGEVWKYIRRKNSIKKHEQGGTIEVVQNTTEIELIDKSTLTDDIEAFQNGGSINIIPEGALHARKHNMEDADNLTKKGIPVVDDNGEQQAEIERQEIILRLEVTLKLEELNKIYEDEKSSQKEKDDAALEAGKLLTYEILHNTLDNTNELI